MLGLVGIRDRFGRVNAHRPVDVLQGTLAKVVEGKSCLSANLPEGVLGKVDAARLAFAFNTGCDIDAIAENIVAIDDDVADIDANTKAHLGLWAIIPFSHLLLDGHGAGDCIHSAGELDQQSISGALDDAAIVGGDRRIDDLAAVSLEGFERACLIGSHQTRITDDISRQYRRQPPIQPLLAHKGIPVTMSL
jgi:hypothetical protein